jgi:hypothetical protein
LFPDAEAKPDDIDVKQEEILKSAGYGTKQVPNVRTINQPHLNTHTLISKAIYFQGQIPWFERRSTRQFDLCSGNCSLHCKSQLWR